MPQRYCMFHAESYRSHLISRIHYLPHSFPLPVYLFQSPPSSLISFFSFSALLHPIPATSPSLAHAIFPSFFSLPRILVYDTASFELAACLDEGLDCVNAVGFHPYSALLVSTSGVLSTQQCNTLLCVLCCIVM